MIQGRPFEALSQTSTGLVVAIQETFSGRTYRYLADNPAQGSVVKVAKQTEEQIHHFHCRVIKKCEPGEAAIVFRAFEKYFRSVVPGKRRLRFYPGPWYRVLED